MVDAWGWGTAAVGFIGGAVLPSVGAWTGWAEKRTIRARLKEDVGLLKELKEHPETEGARQSLVAAIEHETRDLLATTTRTLSADGKAHTFLNIAAMVVGLPIAVLGLFVVFGWLLDPKWQAASLIATIVGLVVSYSGAINYALRRRAILRARKEAEDKRLQSSRTP